MAAEARPGPNGGPQGGVALVIPVKYEILNSRTIIPGLCVDATVMKRGERPRTEWVLRSLYLPPDDRRAAVEAYVEDSRGRNGAVYVGGDLNMQMQRPRNDEEQDDTVMMCEEWQRRGSAPVNQGRNTRQEGRRSAELDYIIANIDAAWKWDVEIRWTNKRTMPG